MPCHPKSFISCLISSIFAIGPAYAETDATSILALDDVLVYAPKRTQALMDVPQAIDVLDEDAITYTRVNDLYDIGRSVANMSVQQSGFYKSITLRGIGGGGRNAGFSSRVGMYLDGVYVGQTLALDNAMLDVAQIEVLKGPQGYLFGNNSDAGIVNIISKQPSHQSEASLKTGIGNYGYRENTLLLNGELTPYLTSRLAVKNETRDGYVNNVFDGEDLKALSNFALRSQFKLEATEALNLTLGVDYMNKHQTQFLAQALTGLSGLPFSASERNNNQFDTVNRNDTPKGVTQSGGVHLNAEYFLPNNASFNSITAYRNNTNQIVQDNDYSAADLINTLYKDEVSQYTQEFRYNSADNAPLKYTLGLYLSKEINKNNSKIVLGSDIGSLPPPVVGLPALPANTVLPMRGNVTTNTVALFSNVDYQFAEKVKLHAGARLSSENKKLDLLMDGSQSSWLGMAVINDRQSISDTFFSPMLGASYHPNAHSQFYFTTAKAYKSGGWNVEFMSQNQANDGYAYEPESVISFEVGFKSKLAHTEFGANVFRNNLTDYQVFQYANLGGFLALQLRNAAKARTQGIEFNIDHAFNDAFGMRANLAYLDAQFLSFPNGKSTGQDAKGEQMPDAPRWSASLTTTYTTHSDWLGGNMHVALHNYIQTDTISGSSSDYSINKLDGRTVHDATLTVETDNKKWLWTLWVKNIGNKEYALAKSADAFGNVYAIYADPRLYGVTGEYRF